MNNKSLFNISIVEIMLILFFMFISLSIYQLTYKNNQISELNEIVESERELLQEIVKKNYPILENKIDDLVNLEKCKKLNIILKNKDTGLNYLTNKMSQDIKNADARKYAKKYDDLKNEKIKLDAQIKNLKGNTLTINVLKELHQQNKPLHQQIINLEQKMKDNYKNRMILINKIHELKTNQKVKYILNKLDKNEAPIHEQITAIGKELNQLNTNTLGKNYNTNTTYVLDNLKQNNKPLQQQIEALQETLLNKNLLLEIDNLKKQLANNLKTGNENLNITNMKKALNNLENIKNNPATPYNSNSKNILEKLAMNNKPLNEQINSLKNKLDLDKQLTQQLAKNLHIGNDNVQRANLKKALDDLQKMKNNATNSYDPNTKALLKNFGIDDKPLLEQISDIKNKLANDNKLQKQNTKHLKSKPEQENKLKKQIKKLEKQINKNLVVKDKNINIKSIEQALNDLNNLNNTKNTHTQTDKIYKDNLKKALQSIKEIQKIKNKLSNKINTKPILNKNINDAIQYLEDKAHQPSLKPTKGVQATLDRFNIKNAKPTNKQLSNLYLNLYSTPSNNTNVSELNFVIKRLNNQKDLNNRVEYINNFLEKTTNTTNNFPGSNENGKNGKNGKNKYSQNEIETLKNQIKYLQKKIERNGVSHLPCFIDDEGSSIFLFILALRDNNIHIELGEHESVPELAKGLPNMDKLVGKTMSLKKFMKLTKPIFEESVQDECRHFVYFKDETISKREYKRKTLTIQHHFYKYIDHRW